VVDLPSHAKVEADKLWIRSFRGNWRPVLNREPNESDEELFSRWLELQTKKVTDPIDEKETNRIAEILSWLIPIFLLALGLWIASLIPD
jgi:hypothetical protein